LLSGTGNKKDRTKSDSSTQAEYAKVIGEQYLRNSANCPRNLGRSGTDFIVSSIESEKATV
jgi:hypothetical protein